MGYGSQALALKYLNIPFEHYKISEWAIKSIQAYKDMHFTDIEEDYTSEMSKEDLIEYFKEHNISSNYNEPMNESQLKKLNEKQLRTIYNNMKICHNLGSVVNIKGKDLEIVDKDKYDYILSYSFPCQDLSNAGLGKGMKDTSTRSGMLWEVERILDELNETDSLPQVLLMENVPMIHSVDNTADFNKWQLKLLSLGYKNYWEDLIATDFEIPQIRNRTFMVSVLGDYNYTFPQPSRKKVKLQEMLEHNVDEKYFISKAMKDYCLSSSSGGIDRSQGFLSTLNNQDRCPTITTNNGSRASDPFVIDNEKLLRDQVCEKYLTSDDAKEYDVIQTNYNSCVLNGSKKMVRMNDVSPTLTTKCDVENGIVVKDETLKEELCNKLIEEGKVQEFDIVKHSYTTQILEGKKKCVEKSNEGITLTTRPDCIGVVVKNKITKEDVENLRIRKLSPRECFRLQGVKDEDYENVQKNQSDAGLFHLAGDSITVTVLMAIFSQFFDIDWRDYMWKVQ